MGSSGGNVMIQHFKIYHGKSFVILPQRIGRGGTALTTAEAITFLKQWHGATKVELVSEPIGSGKS